MVVFYPKAWDLKAHLPSGCATHTAIDWPNVERLMLEYCRAFGLGVHFGLSLNESYAVAAHGEHGVADSHPDLLGNGASIPDKLADSRPNPLVKSEECNFGPFLDLGHESATMRGLPIDAVTVYGHTLLLVRN